MDTSYLIYSLAVGWFTYHVFWMAMRIYQFKAFNKTYGQQPLLSLKDLGEAAYEQQRDIPAFKVIVPAYMETDVIEGTLYQLTSMNYPRTFYEVNVVTYEDEPVEDNRETTTQVVQRVGTAINAEARVDLVHSIVTPGGYDGFFPGNLTASEQHIGKARGLNYALRRIHEENERDERRYFLGKISRSEHPGRIEEILSAFKTGFENTEKYASFIDRYFNPEHHDYIGMLSRTSQLGRLVIAIQASVKSRMLNKQSWIKMVNYINQESPRFFLKMKQVEQAHSDFPELKMHVLQDKQFLYSVMRLVEAEDIDELEKYSIEREAKLEQTRPILFKSLRNTDNCEETFQLARRLNSRWVLVYDADADAPVDVMRHLAGRILAEPEVMGFQGPVAPLLNYDSVHSLCRMGALWMAFWHGAAYPRLLSNKTWAHPLAGTNWCFRIEGFENQNNLIRDCPYDEARRRFLLTFDPRQLTEDLETGIRNFSDWSVNAAWHPIVEMEQVPPTPGAMFRQHTRWSLGTLQMMGYILRSRLHLIQKTWYVMYPLRVLFASSGPFITGGLIIAFYLDVLQVEPIFAWWTLFLAFGNFVYIWAFVETFERYYDKYQQSSAVNFLYKNRTKLIECLSSKNVCFTTTYAHLIRNTLHRINNGMKPDGFVTRYLQSRYIEDENDNYSSTASKSYVDSLKKVTPTSIHPEYFYSFMTLLGDIVAKIPIKDAGSDDCMALLKDQKSFQTSAPALLDKMVILVENATHKAGVGKKPRWSRYHTQILLWAIPFIYFSVTPFFNAFWRWAKGEKTPWNKTTRTTKKQIRTVEKNSSEFSYKEDK